MKIKTFVKKHILIVTLLVLTVFTFAFSKAYIDYQNQLEQIRSERLVKQAELAEVKKEYEDSLKKMDDANNAKAKEKKIREKLNMIKKDEIQFSFTE